MCGRYSLADLDDLSDRFKLANDAPNLKPHYNVSPTQTMPVVVRADDGNRVELMGWGLIPSWNKKGKGFINARAETASAKPSFKRAFRSSRCLVPASSFFEWKQTSEGKVPHLIKLKDQALFALAGLYEEWTNAEGEPIKTYAILTCGPNKLMASIHNRMPVILTHKAEDLWLNPATELPALRQLLKPYAASQMEAYPVSRDVNSSSNEGPELIKALA